MTHDELIAKMDDLDVAIANGFGKADVILGCIKATRAVVELHKPVIHALPDETCLACQDLYPCDTIQAIEKELQ